MRWNCWSRPRVVKKLKRDDGPLKYELGTPDLNVYKTTLGFGWPLTWITWEHSWNQAAGDDETELGRFQLINFVIHTLGFSRRFPLKRFHEPADVRLHFDLIECERLDFLRQITNRW